jgi:CO dehydrogenase maturation factor
VSKVIAFAGKGGTGKTTMAALTIRSLVRTGLIPVLGVDADPNSCLGEMLGAFGAKTIGQTRERFADSKMDLPAGMSKETVFQTMMNEIIVEKKGWDLLVMGRPEGPGCYCFANNILRRFLEMLGGNYRYVVIDHEAGMEHLSRHNTGRADFLFIVAEPSVTSLRAARRIKDLTAELGLVIGRCALILNRVDGGGGIDDGNVRKELEASNLEVAAEIPFDDNLVRAEISKTSFLDLPDEWDAVKAAQKIYSLIT